MNNGGQVIVLKFMIAIAIIVVVLAFAPLMKNINDDARSAPQMDCDNESISDFDKAACLSSDSSLFLIIASGLIIALAIFGIKRFSLK